MPAQRTKQALKNAVYRGIGEASAALRPSGEGEARALRVLAYHKVNDLPGNPMTVPPRRFAEQLELLGELGYRVVDLDAVARHYLHGEPLPERPVLITFDDGYRDTLEQAAPLLERHGYPAVVFVPVGFMDGTAPLPHEARLAARGLRNPTLDWGLLRELEATGVRVESHGLDHRPLAELGLEGAARELALSKLELEQRLGRPARAFAYVKGSRAHFQRVHESLAEQAGYELAFSTVSHANGPGADRFALGRYNVEPYSPRSFELVLAGACEAIAVKDTVAGTHARRLFNRALGTASQ